MKVNLWSKSNAEIVSFVIDEVTAYESQKAREEYLYGGTQLSDLQKYEAYLSRAVMCETPGAVEIRNKVRDILHKDARI